MGSIFLRLRVGFITFRGLFYYVWGSVILTFLELVFLRLGVSDSYLWRLVFSRLRVSFLTFGGWFYYVWGLVIFTFLGLVFLRLGVSNSYVLRVNFLTFRG